MTDPLRPRDHNVPRAAPLQPDKPGSGRRQEQPDEQPGASPTGAKRDDSLRRALEQEDTAVDNVQRGYN